jgi:hypothetical protein
MKDIVLIYVRGWWAVKTKYQLEELTSRDDVMAERLQACLDSSRCNDEALKGLYNHVLNSHGA